MIGDIGAGIGGAIGGIAVLAGAGGKGGDKYYKEALAVMRAVQDPNFDFRQLTPPQLAILAELDPQTYEVRVPDELKTIADSPELRAAQVQGVQKFQEAGREGLPLQERLAAQGIQEQAASEASRMNESVLRDIAQRGGAGGGAEIAARMQANQGAANRASQMGSDLALEAARNRLMFSGEAANMAGQVRGQDVDLRGRNAQMTNQFNQNVANMFTQRNQEAAGARERAQGYNVQQRQGVGEANVMNRYNTQLQNLSRKNQLEQQLFGARMDKATALAGALGRRGLQKDQDKAAKEKTIMSIGQGVGGAAGGALEFL